jgi:putative Mg2+ transporter-C (MgtC) family protein
VIDNNYLNIVANLLVALIAGALVGFERSYQGRPAGFRTHTLVCMASAVLMLLTVYQSAWFPASHDVVRIDPTRMAQGIMTGIGFLGAGVIVKEGASVRGLTTAASIWITAAIGILAGVGFYFPVVVVTILTLGTLSMFRWIEARMPQLAYMRHVVRFRSDKAIPDADYRELIVEHGLRVSEFNYTANNQECTIEYHMVISTRDIGAERKLARTLGTHPDVLLFSLESAGD